MTYKVLKNLTTNLFSRNLLSLLSEMIHKYQFSSLNLHLHGVLFLKSENLWLERNYHGISWKSGEILYYEFEETHRNILQNAKVHVKGFKKQRWLQRYLSNVQNIEDLECPSLQKLYANLPCDNHGCWESYMSPNCAARNFIALKNWLTDFYKSPSIKESRDEVDNASVECL